MKGTGDPRMGLGSTPAKKAPLTDQSLSEADDEANGPTQHIESRFTPQENSLGVRWRHTHEGDRRTKSHARKDNSL